MNKLGIEKRLNALEERRSPNPVRVVDMTDLQLEGIVGGHLTDEELERIAHGAEILIIDDIPRGKHESN